jgi:hypothetical protein
VCVRSALLVRSQLLLTTGVDPGDPAETAARPRRQSIRSEVLHFAISVVLYP